MNVLVIAPHPDDDSIGCGGALCIHSQRGDRVSVAFLTSGELGLKHLKMEKARTIREREARAAARVLKLSTLHFLRCSDWTLDQEIRKAAKLLRPILKQTKPAIIYLPHPEEWHPDHKAALPIVKTAIRGSGIKEPVLRAYEIWTPLQTFDDVEDISRVMKQKLRAVAAHESQMHEFDYLRAISGLNQYRGVMGAKSDYAEVFKYLTLSINNKV